MLVDSYFDKLLHAYIGCPGMEWLIDRNDPYFDLAVQMANEDSVHLPEADVLVFFRVPSKDIWNQFIRNRGRELDHDDEFRRSFEAQDLLLAASRQYCESTSIPLVLFDQDAVGIEHAAEALETRLFAPDNPSSASAS